MNFGFNRKEEREKSKLSYDILEKILYNDVIPQELNNIVKDIITQLDPIGK
jgi:hypothetical protein